MNNALSPTIQPISKEMGFFLFIKEVKYVGSTRLRSLLACEVSRISQSLQCFQAFIQEWTSQTVPSLLAIFQKGGCLLEDQ